MVLLPCLKLTYKNKQIPSVNQRAAQKPYIESLYKMGLVEQNLTLNLLTNIALACAFCRLYYRRKPGAIPESMPAHAAVLEEMV